MAEAGVMDTRAALSSQSAVVGSLLVDPGICGELFAELRADDFISSEHRSVYEAARELFFEDAAVDPLTILDRMGGGEQTRGFLMELMDVTPTAANWKEYAAIVREQARLWRLRNLGLQLSAAVTLREAQNLVEQAQIEGSKIGQRSAVTMAAGVTDFLLRASRPVEYIDFGIAQLNEKLYASPGDFIVVGGRPSAGKTMLSVQMADKLSETYRVGYFSLETSPQKLFDRFITQAIPLDFQKVKQHELGESGIMEVSLRKKDLLGHKLEVIPASGYTVDDIRAETLAGRYDVIIIDYLQLVRSDGSGKQNRTEEVGAVSRALHTLAQRHGILVIALAQLNRGTWLRDEQGNPTKEAAPTLTSLRESGQIEQDADIVMLLYLDTLTGSTDRILKVVKNKEGTLGEVALAFDGKAQRLEERMEADSGAQQQPEERTKPGSGAQQQQKERTKPSSGAQQLKERTKPDSGAQQLRLEDGTKPNSQEQQPPEPTLDRKFPRKPSFSHWRCT